MPVQQTASTHVRSSYCSIVSKRCSTSKTYCTEGDSNSVPSMAADSVPLDYLSSALCGGVLHIVSYKPSPLEKQDLGFVLQNPNLFMQMQMHMTTAESSVRLSCCNFVRSKAQWSLPHWPIVHTPTRTVCYSDCLHVVQGCQTVVLPPCTETLKLGFIWLTQHDQCQPLD